MSEREATYTLDAQMPDGRYASDSGLTAQDVENAKANAARLGITILGITVDRPVTPGDLAPFGVR